MKIGDRVRVDLGNWMCKDLQDFTLEEFRYALGFFESESHRLMGKFTPLCNLYERGPDSENAYMSNMGEYVTNMVPAFMELPS